MSTSFKPDPSVALAAEIARLHSRIAELERQVAELRAKVYPPPTRFMTLEDWLDR